MKNKYLFLIISLISCFTSAKAVEICGAAKHGEILIGKIDPNQKAIFNDEELMVTDDGFFLLAFGRDEINSQSLKVMSTNISLLHTSEKSMRGILWQNMTLSMQKETKYKRELIHSVKDTLQVN